MLAKNVFITAHLSPSESSCLLAELISTLEIRKNLALAIYFRIFSELLAWLKSWTNRFYISRWDRHLQELLWWLRSTWELMWTSESWISQSENTSRRLSWSWIPHTKFRPWLMVISFWRNLALSWLILWTRDNKAVICIQLIQKQGLVSISGSVLTMFCSSKTDNLSWVFSNIVELILNTVCIPVASIVQRSENNSTELTWRNQRCLTDRWNILTKF